MRNCPSFDRPPRKKEEKNHWSSLHPNYYSRTYINGRKVLRSASVRAMAFLGARGRAIPRCSSCTARRIFSFNPYRKPSPAWIRDFSSSGGKRPQPGDAPKKDKIQWYPIPVGLGIGVVGLVQFYKVSAREKERQREAEEGPAPKARPRVKRTGLATRAVKAADLARRNMMMWSLKKKRKKRND